MHRYDGGDWPNVNGISFSTNQQSFYRHSSDSYTGNLNLMHRYLGNQTLQKDDILF